MSDLDSYRALYVAESRENLENITKNLLILEKGSNDQAIAEIFRSAHSLKGMSASMGFVGMEQICHAMEDIFQSFRSGDREVDPGIIDLLLKVIDCIESMVDDIESGGQGQSPSLPSLLESLRSWGCSGGAVPRKGHPVPDISCSGGTQDALPGGNDAGVNVFRLTIDLEKTCDTKNLRGMIILQNLDSLGDVIDVFPSREIIEDGEFDGHIRVTVRTENTKDAVLAAARVNDVCDAKIDSVNTPTTPVRDKETGILCSKEPEKGIPEAGPDKEMPDAGTDKSREVKNIRVDIGRLDRMMNLIEDLVINRGRVIEIAQEHRIRDLDETLGMIGRSVADLQNLMMNIRMIPLSHIFNRFPRTVRDLSRKMGKDIELQIEGGQTELDRSVMEGLNDPLLHLIRNAIDHGIEFPGQREESGKSPKGLIHLSARRDRDNVVIVIQDDGRGIDSGKVLEKAKQRGLISEDQVSALSRDEIFDLLFLPGFSTAEKVTDVSGRGVGLDVVRTAIKALKGTVTVDSTPGKGTKFELILPPTMAIVDVMMVRINGRRCAIPVHDIVEVASMSTATIHPVANRETILLRDQLLPLRRLEDMFGPSSRGEIIVILQNASRRIAVMVDAIIGQQEVVIKPLAKIVGACPGIGGVTIPGDGLVVPVLDVNSMVMEN
jgi:two-component system chemotaxis sensor kinase CheA